MCSDFLRGPPVLLLFAYTALKPPDILNFSEHQAFPCHILHSHFACGWKKIVINWGQSELRLQLNRHFLNYTESFLKSCTFLWLGPSPKGFSAFAGKGGWCWSLTHTARPGSSAMGAEMEKFCWGQQLCCCSGPCLALLSSGSLLVGRGWTVKLCKKHFFRWHSVTSTSWEDCGWCVGVGGNPQRRWLCELLKETSLLPPNI